MNSSIKALYSKISAIWSEMEARDFRHVRMELCARCNGMFLSVSPKYEGLEPPDEAVSTHLWGPICDQDCTEAPRLIAFELKRCSVEQQLSEFAIVKGDDDTIWRNIHVHKLGPLLEAMAEEEIALARAE